MSRWLLVLSNLFALVAIGLFVCAGYLHWREGTRDDVSIVVEEPSRVLTGLQPKKEYDVEFRVRNLSWREVRIVGASVT
jgi:hypothetical protein